jgi:hypothetical protein
MYANTDRTPDLSAISRQFIERRRAISLIAGAGLLTRAPAEDDGQEMLLCDVAVAPTFGHFA